MAVAGLVQEPPRELVPGKVLALNGRLQLLAICLVLGSK